MTNKDLLRQYVDTGLRIDQYQYGQLPPNLLKTYIRKRIISGDLTWEEYKVMPKEFEDLFYKNVTSYSTSMIQLFKREYINDNKINRMIDVKGKENLLKDERLIGMMVNYADNDLQVGKKLIDVMGSEVGTDLLVNILRNSTVDNTRPLLIEYFIENYLRDSPFIEGVYENIVTGLLAQSDYDVIKFSSKIIDVLGEKLNRRCCIDIVSYLFSRTFYDDFNYSDVIIDFIDKIKNHKNAGELTYVFLGRLSPNDIHKVMSTVDKNVLNDMSNYTFYLTRLTTGNNDDTVNYAFSDAFEKYIPLDKLEPSYIKLIKSNAMHYREQEEIS